MLFPPARSRPRPSTLIRPSVFTSALRAAILQIWPGGGVPRTKLRFTASVVSGCWFAGGGGITPLETGSTPIPPSNLTRVFRESRESLESFAARATGRSKTTRVASASVLFMLDLHVSLGKRSQPELRPPPKLARGRDGSLRRYRADKPSAARLRVASR